MKGNNKGSRVKNIISNRTTIMPVRSFRLKEKYSVKEFLCMGTGHKL
jgi:hypothetical protein